jgi:hypothetical protein
VAGCVWLGLSWLGLTLVIAVSWTEVGGHGVKAGFRELQRDRVFSNQLYLAFPPKSWSPIPHVLCLTLVSGIACASIGNAISHCCCIFAKNGYKYR